MKKVVFIIETGC